MTADAGAAIEDWRMQGGRQDTKKATVTGLSLFDGLAGMKSVFLPFGKLFSVFEDLVDEPVFHRLLG